MRWVASAIASIFGFTSGVVRNARTFHPDGRTFLGTVSADASDQTLLRAGKLLEGRVLLRIGMGLAKTSAPAWIKNNIPDAPSVAARFSPSPNGDVISQRDRGKDDLDILFTAGGDRLWKLIANLASGGHCYGLNRFDYFKNQYFADVPYRVPACGLNVWLRLRPLSGGEADAARPDTPAAREQALSEAVANGAEFVIEAQSVAVRNAPYVPVAKVRLNREIEIDQEALHYQPTAGRGFEPHGMLTALREKVYPVSAHARPPNREQRVIRDREGFFCRLIHRSYRSTAGGAWFSPRRLICALGLFLLALALGSSGYALWRFLPDHPIPELPDNPNLEYSQAALDAQRFKYGSTGGEANLGIPLLIWQATPLVCAETLKKVVGDRMAADYVTRVQNYSPRADGGPDPTRLALSREGYQALGLIFETEDSDRDKSVVFESNKDGTPKDIPVGVSKRRNLGFDRAFVNCAFCHTSTVRVSADSQRRLVLGMPANLLDIRNFEDFLFTCTSGQQFSKENLIPEIENMSGRLSLLDRYLLYPLAIWIIRDRVQYLSSRLGFFAKQPEWGPGRVDTFSNAKGIFNWPWQKLPNWHTDHWVERDEIGTVDFPSIWNQGLRKKRGDGCPMELHWDGNNDLVEERDLSAAFGTGALPPNIDHKNLGKIEDWLIKRSVPPKFTAFFPDAFDRQLADRGGNIYAGLCAKCHGANGQEFTGELVGRVTPIDDIGTDPYRLNNYTEELASTQAMLYAGEKKAASASSSAPEDEEQMKACGLAAHGNAEENTYRFKRFHKTYGYANLPLDGIWLRAPFLHNGSVPTLWDLLKPANERPAIYYRGSDVYDPEAMGFKWESPTAPDGTMYFRYDTTQPGNSNSGHLYGTDLTEADKRALIEFLKTF